LTTTNNNKSLKNAICGVFSYLYIALERFEVLFVDIFIIIVYCIIKSVKAGAGL
jgi:hypothetical protein